MNLELEDFDDMSNVRIKTITFKKPERNKYRWIACEKLEKWPLLNDGDVYMVTEPEFVGKFIERQDIEVLPRRGTDYSGPR